MIIAIDGPAGAGKSTVAKAIAAHFGFAYVNTGAMYRAVALCALEQGLALPADEDAVVALARDLPIALHDAGSRVFVGERDVTDFIRTSEIGDFTSRLATLPGVREVIVAQQKRIGRDSEGECGGAVLEGRDIQTVVFPEADLKIFLTATPRARAARRLSEWTEKNQEAEAAAPFTHEEAERDVIERDHRDSTRQTSPLKAAPDAVHVLTDDLTPGEVVARIAQLIEARQGKSKPIAS